MHQIQTMTERKSIIPKSSNDVAEKRSSSGDISAFLKAARDMPSAGSGRIILVLDATMSRQPTWDMACSLQAKMFSAAGKDGNLAVQLIYFRGLSECRASKFVIDTQKLGSLMSGLTCQGGLTQIGKVFRRSLQEHAEKKVSAVIFIGDAMEEGVDALAALAGEMGLRGLPIFLFQEGHDPKVEVAFKEFARLSRGGWFRFDRSSPDALGKLLNSIALYASGGKKALLSRNEKSDQLLLGQLKSGEHKI